MSNTLLFCMVCLLTANQMMAMRSSCEVPAGVDGTIYPLKGSSATYKQCLDKGECYVQFNDRLIPENGTVQVRRKYYRVENCQLERVFHACGPNLLLMLSVVCRVVDQHTSSQAALRLTRAGDSSMSHVSYRDANRSARMITESCCENLCSIAELTRYCPSRGN